MGFGDNQEKLDSFRKTRTNFEHGDAVKVNNGIKIEQEKESSNIYTFSMKPSTKKKIKLLKEHYNKKSESALLSELIEKLYEDTF